MTSLLDWRVGRCEISGWWLLHAVDWNGKPPHVKCVLLSLMLVPSLSPSLCLCVSLSLSLSVALSPSASLSLSLYLSLYVALSMLLSLSILSLYPLSLLLGIPREGSKGEMQVICQSSALLKTIGEVPLCHSEGICWHESQSSCAPSQFHL